MLHNNPPPPPPSTFATASSALSPLNNSTSTFPSSFPSAFPSTFRHSTTPPSTSSSAPINANLLSPTLRDLHVPPTTPTRPILLPRSRTAQTPSPPSDQLHTEAREAHEAKLDAKFSQLEKTIDEMSSYLNLDSNRPKNVSKERWKQIRTNIHRARTLASPSVPGTPLRKRHTDPFSTPAPPPSTSKRMRPATYNPNNTTTSTPFFAPPPVTTPAPTTPSRKRQPSPSLSGLTNLLRTDPPPKRAAVQTPFGTPQPREPPLQTPGRTERKRSNSIETPNTKRYKSSHETTTEPKRVIKRPISLLARKKAKEAKEAEKKRRDEDVEEVREVGVKKRRTKKGFSGLGERVKVVGVKRGRDGEDEEGREQGEWDVEMSLDEGVQRGGKRIREGYRQEGDPEPEVEYYEPGELDSDSESESDDNEVEVYWTIVKDEDLRGEKRREVGDEIGEVEREGWERGGKRVRKR